MGKRGVARRGFLLLTQITTTHYLYLFHMLSTKKLQQQKKDRNVFHPSPLFSILTYSFKQQKNMRLLRKKMRNFALPPTHHTTPC
jgi:hypothetical protein